VRAQLDAAKGVVIENIEKIMERGDRIEILVAKTSELSHESTQFKAKAASMKRRFWWKNVRLALIITGLVLFVVFLIVWFACGVPAFQSCTGSSPPSSPNTPTATPTVPTGVPTTPVFIGTK